MSSNGMWIRPKRRREIYARDGWKCVRCALGPEHGIKLTLNHKTPRALGGGHESENLETLCLSCKQLGAGTTRLRDRS